MLSRHEGKQRREGGEGTIYFLCHYVLCDGAMRYFLFARVSGGMKMTGYHDAGAGVGGRFCWRFPVRVCI